jgi:amino acid transporter
VAGSIYTYSYATLGELVAWMIGWDLLLEYGLATSAVSVGWSGYFQSLMAVSASICRKRCAPRPAPCPACTPVQPAGAVHHAGADGDAVAGACANRRA